MHAWRAPSRPTIRHHPSYLNPCIARRAPSSSQTAAQAAPSAAGHPAHTPHDPRRRQGASAPPAVRRRNRLPAAAAELADERVAVGAGHRLVAQEALRREEGALERAEQRKEISERSIGRRPA